MCVHLGLRQCLSLLTLPPAACAFIPGDINDDSLVTVLDPIALSSIILRLLELPEGAFCAGDVDGNNIINASDFFHRHRSHCRIDTQGSLNDDTKL